MDVIDELIAYCEAWEPWARVMGNVCAGDAAQALRSLRAELELHKGALIAEQEHVETLEAELAACREDAERYRWLREHWDDVNHPVDFIICNSFVTTLDADVDAARKGEVET